MLGAIRSVRGFDYILSFVLLSFIVTNSIPLNAQPTTLDQAFLLRMENARHIIMNLFEAKKIGDLVEYFFVLKADVESQYNIQIDFDDFFAQLNNYMESQGFFISKKKMEVIKMKFKMHEMKLKGSPFKLQIEEVEEKNPLNSFSYDAKVGNGPGSAGVSQEDIPSDLIVGVTMGLCGILLMFIPIPVVQAYGAPLAGAGALMAINSVCRENDARNYPNMGAGHSYRLR